jgi:hypothetical protein
VGLPFYAMRNLVRNIFNRSTNDRVFGFVTPQMIRERTIELAMRKGRSANCVLKSDWERAKRELLGGGGSDQ